MNGIKVLIVVATLLLGFGFNTIDVMVWNFYWHEWRLFSPNLWAWTPTVKFDVWFSYFFGGILPFGLGAFLLGFVFGIPIKQGKMRS